MTNGIYEKQTLNPETLLFGNNEFETGVLNIAEPGEGEKVNVIDGTILTRDSDTGKYVLADSETIASGPLFILVERVETPITEAGDFAVRVCISGSVNRDLLNLAGDELSSSDVDSLRTWGILALPAKKA